MSFPYHISLIIPLPNHLLTSYLFWANHPKYPLCNKIRTTSSDMDGITHAQCKHFRIISHLFSIASSYTWHSFPSIWTGHVCSHSRLNSKSKGLAVPYVWSLPLFVQYPLQLQQETTGRNKAIIRGSCSPNPQNGIPVVTVNSKSASFPICFIHRKVII